MSIKDVVLVEKYRPKSIKEVVGKSKEQLLPYLDNNATLPHFIFYSTFPGTGKTSLAKAFANDLGCDLLLLNSSDERKIEVIRDKVKIFASSLSSKKDIKKCVFLDEADGMCLEENTLVKVFIDNKIQDLPIRDLSGKKFQVVSLDRFKKAELVDAIAFQNEDVEVYEIELEDGRVIQCSKNHPFFQKLKHKNDKEYHLVEKKLKELHVGDAIVDVSYLKNHNSWYFCRICGQIFTHKCNLSWHVKNRHGISKEDYFNRFLRKKDDKDSCKICGEKAKFGDIIQGYQQYCSRSCASVNAGRVAIAKNPWITKRGRDSFHKKVKGKKYEELYGKEKAQTMKRRMSEANRRFRESAKGKIILEENKKKQSITMKNKILTGEFTPCKTSSWTHWTAQSTITGKLLKFRSNWEVKIFEALIRLGVKQEDIGYEKIRLPYIHKGEKHIYMVDFIIYSKRIILEIKPFCHVDSPKAKIKNLALLKFCSENNYRSLIISEDLVFSKDLDLKLKGLL